MNHEVGKICSAKVVSIKRKIEVDKLKEEGKEGRGGRRGGEEGGKKGRRGGGKEGKRGKGEERRRERSKKGRRRKQTSISDTDLIIIC